MTFKKKKLDKLRFLAIDCQATGPNPESHQLLEIGWAQASRRQSIRSRSFLVRPPEGFVLPGAVSRVTGITAEDLADARSEELVWQKLLRAARRLRRENGTERCPVLIHFARFEKAYLRDLHERYNKKRDFPFQIVCTHQIARRLLTGLPRKGLRAVAGYFGHGLDENRRASAHAEATLRIWENMVPLIQQLGFDSLEELEEWLSATESATTTGRSYPMPASSRKALPDHPGVYRMLRAGGEVLYVGKAMSLKKRVNSYFQKKSGHAEHILEMLSQARDLRVTSARTALEAALLENDEIKRLRPPYNKALRAREREIVFYSRNLMRCSNKPGKDYCVGPVTGQQSLTGLRLLHSFLSDHNTGIDTGMLGFDQESGPDEDCLFGGLELFADEWFPDRSKPAGLHELLRIGRTCWIRSMEKKEAQVAEVAEEESDQEELEEEADDEPWSWTPGTVNRMIHGVVKSAYHQLRRARFFCWLSDSVVSWTTNDETVRCLVFESGHIAHAFDMEADAAVPAPKRSTGWLKRQRSFDVRCYDQMRVLTTELKRIRAAERPVSISFVRGKTLADEDLDRVLWWL